MILQEEQGVISSMVVMRSPPPHRADTHSHAGTIVANGCIETSPRRGPAGHTGLPRQHLGDRILKRDPVPNQRGSLVLFSGSTPGTPWPSMIINNGNDFTIYKNKRLQRGISNTMGLKN